MVPFRRIYSSSLLLFYPEKIESIIYFQNEDWKQKIEYHVYPDLMMPLCGMADELFLATISISQPLLYLNDKVYIRNTDQQEIARWL